LFKATHTTNAQNENRAGPWSGERMHIVHRIFHWRVIFRGKTFACKQKKFDWEGLNDSTFVKLHIIKISRKYVQLFLTCYMHTDEAILIRALQECLKTRGKWRYPLKEIIFTFEFVNALWSLYTRDT
jgi:hypothetical protein